MSCSESINWGVKTPAIVHGRMRHDVEEQNVNKEHRQTKNNNNKMKIKNERKMKLRYNNNKNLLGGTPKQSTITGIFDFSTLKK